MYPVNLNFSLENYCFFYLCCAFYDYYFWFDESCKV